MNMNYYISIFETKNKAVFLYSVLETMGYRIFQLISTPCAIKAGCNYSIKFPDKSHIDILINTAKEIGIEMPDIYYAEKKDGKYKYKKILI